MCIILRLHTAKMDRSPTHVALYLFSALVLKQDGVHIGCESGMDDVGKVKAESVL